MTARVPTYRIENSHVPIIDKRTFKQVQRILELRAPRVKSPGTLMWTARSSARTAVSL